MSEENTEEIHGVFRFSDDHFKNNESRQLIINGKCMSYLPLVIFDNWFVTASPTPAFDQIQLSYYTINSMYLRGKYKDCSDLISSVLKDLKKHNSRERELLETLARCSVRLNDENTAIGALDVLNTHHLVEEPGLSLLKAFVYFHFGLFEKGLFHGEEYLRLRPNDILMHIQIADNLRQFNPSKSIEHYENALKCLWGYRRSERETAEHKMSYVNSELSKLRLLYGQGC